MRDAVDDAAPDRFAGQFALAPMTDRQIAVSGGSQDSAIISQICSGVNVAGAPGRGASASRATRCSPARPASGRASDAPSSARRRVGGRSRAPAFPPPTAGSSRPVPPACRRLVRPGKPPRSSCAGVSRSRRRTGQGERRGSANQDRALIPPATTGWPLDSGEGDPDAVDLITIVAHLWQQKLTRNRSRHFRRGVWLVEAFIGARTLRTDDNHARSAAPIRR